MESLLPELIAPILDCVTFESLQSLSMLESSWLESTKIALASRFEGAVTIAFVKGSDLVEYSMEKRPIRKQNRFFRMLSVFDAEPRSSWTFIPGDAANIETLSLSVKMIDPRKDKGLEEGVRQDRAPFLQEIGKVFRLMTSCRKVVINIAKLDAYPEDLLALLPRDGLPGKVFLDTIDCDVIPPFDIPIRLRRVPFDSLSTDALQEASTLHGEHALDWLQKLWHRQPHVMWDDPIPIFVDHSWFYLHPPYFFTMSPERLDSMYFVLIKRRYTMAQQHSTTRGKPLMTLDGFGYVQHKLNSVVESALSEKASVVSAAAGFNKYDSYYRVVRRCRELPERKDVDRVLVSQVVLAGGFTNTKLDGGERFLAWDSRSDHADLPVIFLFLSDHGVDRLRRFVNWCGDGQFSLVPKNLMQLYTVGVLIDHHFIPLCRIAPCTPIFASFRRFPLFCLSCEYQWYCL
ncbi:hypothetical protein QR680_018839 [Steinernema hermaphroditum]|uniref:Uncharacterized protein n=1 Tax=Steinernema hermaphroditum TaxID=289476 RepID=A0AA39HJ56_9BILA|nr:hypothetical protein QR680_018839 [Steinernema hermaphroditum]